MIVIDRQWKLATLCTLMWLAGILFDRFVIR